MSVSITLLMMGVGLLAIYLGKLSGPVWDLVKAGMFMLLAASLMRVLPVDFLQEWSREAVGQTTITSSVVTALTFLLVFTIIIGKMPFVKPGTTPGSVVMGALLIIGGTYSVGAAGWTTLAESVGDAVLAIAKIVGALVVILTAGSVKIG